MSKTSDWSKNHLIRYCKWYIYIVVWGQLRYVSVSSVLFWGNSQLYHGWCYGNVSSWKWCLNLCVKSHQFVGSGRSCDKSERDSKTINWHLCHNTPVSLSSWSMLCMFMLISCLSRLKIRWWTNSSESVWIQSVQKVCARVALGGATCMHCKTFLLRKLHTGLAVFFTKHPCLLALASCLLRQPADLDYGS